MKYRKIVPQIWRDDKVRQLDHDAKLIALYCLTGQSNRIGFFPFSPGSAMEDLDFDRPRFERAFDAVISVLGWGWDPAARVLFIPSWWKYNTPENPNVLKGNLTDLDEVPTSPLFQEFSDNLKYLPETLHPTFRQCMAERLPNVSGRFAKRSRNVRETSTERHLTNPKRSPKRHFEPKSEQKQERDLDGEFAPTPSGAPSSTPVQSSTSAMSERYPQRYPQRYPERYPQPLANQEQEQEQEQKQEQEQERESARALALTESFERFQEAYPKKTNREAALKEWKQLQPDPTLVDTILTAIEKQKQSAQWQERQYIENPARWLEEKRWTDEKPAPSNGNGSSHKHKAFTGADWENDKYKHLINVGVSDGVPRSQKRAAQEPEPEPKGSGE